MKATILILLIIVSYYASAQSNPTLRSADKIRIKEAINISGKYSEQLFGGLSHVPFAILLITDSTEFLMYHPKPSNDFKFIGYDALLQTARFNGSI